MPSATTLKLSKKLEARIARLANQTGRSAHSVMLDALERGLTRAECMREIVREIVREALDSDAGVEAGAAVYRAEDVHAWVKHLAKGAKPARPRPWRR